MDGDGDGMGWDGMGWCGEVVVGRRGGDFFRRGDGREGGGLWVFGYVSR